MFYFIIALLILAGIGLLIIEFFVLPGITFAGIIGFILIGFGIYAAYKTFGSTVGNITVLVSTILFLSLLFYALKSGSYKKIALKSEIKSKVNIIDEEKVKAGDQGIAISRLAPMGKVKINDTVVEAKSTGIYIAENTKVEVIKVNGSNIIVKPLN